MDPVPVTDYLKPEGLYRPRGFVHTTISTGSRAVHAGGQISVDDDMVLLHAGDHRAQTELAMRISSRRSKPGAPRLATSLGSASTSSTTRRNRTRKSSLGLQTPSWTLSCEYPRWLS